MQINQTATLPGTGATVTVRAAPYERVLTVTRGSISLLALFDMNLQGSGPTTCLASGSPGGVALCEMQSHLYMERVALYDGCTLDNGGGLAVTTGCSARLVHATLYNNTAHKGGGVYVNGPSTANLQLSTVAENRATAAGGGVRAMDGASHSALHLECSVVAANHAPDDRDLSAAPRVFYSRGGNLIDYTDGLPKQGLHRTDGYTDKHPRSYQFADVAVPGAGTHNTIAVSNTSVVALRCPASSLLCEVLETDASGAARPQPGACATGAREPPSAV